MNPLSVAKRFAGRRQFLSRGVAGLSVVITCGLAMGCGPSAPRATLHQSVQKGDLKAVQQHIAAGTDLNAKDRVGYTALQLAVLKGDLPVVKALVAGGADLNRTGPGGKTALDLSREKGRVAITQVLMQRPEKGSGGRGLMDGGLGVSEVLANP